MSRPLTTHRTIITIPATAAEPARPRSGARANASPPKHIAMNPHNRANPIAPTGGIWSPSAASPKAFELTKIMIATKAIASHSIVRWAATFSRAIRRLPKGPAATKSRLPRRVSPASVPDSARIDQSAVPSVKIGAVLPAHVAAQRAELRPEQRGVAEEVDHRGGQAADELVDLEARLRGREDRPDRGAQDERRARRGSPRRRGTRGASRERSCRRCCRSRRGAGGAGSAGAGGASRCRRQLTWLGSRLSSPAGGVPWPYSARNVSSRLGSRLTKSSSS